MSSFPPANWEVRYLKDMDALTATPDVDDRLSMEAFLAVRPSGGEEGTFRFALWGPEDLRLYFPVTAVLQADIFRGMHVEAHLDTRDQIRLERNSACSRWVEIVELVSSQDVDIVDSQGEIISEKFLNVLTEYKKTAPWDNSGICLRWMLGTVGDEVDIVLIAQALPCSISTIEGNPSLRSDHTRGIMVGKFPLQYERFNDVEASGPVPTFFSNKPEQTLEELRKDPDFAFKCLQALVSRLLVRKDLTTEEALAYMANPEEGDSRRGLKRTWKADEPESGPSKPTGKGRTTPKSIKRIKIKGKFGILFPYAGKASKGRPAKNPKKDKPEAEGTPMGQQRNVEATSLPRQETRGEQGTASMSQGRASTTTSKEAKRPASGLNMGRIPKKTPVIEPDSEEEDLGYGKVSTRKNFLHENKITCGTKLNSLIKPEKLLGNDMFSLCEKFKTLVVYSSSNQSWKKHSCAVNLYEEFCNKLKVNCSWPISIERARAFSTWAVTEKKLKCNTVKSYLSSLNVLHDLSNLKHENFNSDKCTKLALRGAENIEKMCSKKTKTKLAMNIHMLKLLGHRICELNWSELSKQVIWTACTVCFFSSCRMGELLTENEYKFNSAKTVTWEQVMFTDEKECTIFVPYSKTRGFEGKFLDIFRLKNSNCCPAAALCKLKKLNVREKVFNKGNPVFSFKSGKGLTKNFMNNLLRILLSDFTDENHIITGHSFRAGLPSAIASYPEKNKMSDMLEWGGWETKEGFSKYKKQDRAERRALFYKIVECL